MYNFDSETNEAATVSEVIEFARAAYGNGEALYGDGTEGPHGAGWPALEIAAVRQLVSVRPRPRLADAVDRRMALCRARHDGANTRIFRQTETAAHKALV